jgi:hypothetical protein
MGKTAPISPDRVAIMMTLDLRIPLPQKMDSSFTDDQDLAT